MSSFLKSPIISIILKKLALSSLGGFLFLFLSLCVLNLYIATAFQKSLYRVDRLPEKHVGVVLGAAVIRGNLSSIYQDRLQTAIEAYQTGKIEKIIISGDNGSHRYNEILPAKLYLSDAGIPQDDIFLDFAGFDTYDSIYRANYIFGGIHITLFSQAFHLPRALYICNELGFDCVGAISDRQPYLGMKRYMVREYFSRYKAFLETLFHVEPKFLGPKISLDGPSNYSDQ